MADKDKMKSIIGSLTMLEYQLKLVEIQTNCSYAKEMANSLAKMTNGITDKVKALQ